MNILVIKQSALGDVLHCTGHISAIRAQFPEANIVVLTSRACAPLLRHHSAIDQLLEFDRDLFRHDWWGGLVSMMRLIKTVRQHDFDLAIDLQGRARSAVFLRFARARRKYIKGRFAFIEGFEDRSLHAIDEMTEVLRVAGIHVDSVNMHYPLTDAGLASVDKIIHAHQGTHGDHPFVIVSPFSTHPAKDWPLSQFAPLVAALLQQQGSNYHFYFTGTADRAGEIARLVEGIDSPQVSSLAGSLGLDEFAALTSRAALTITGDSFPMHLAAALSTPLLCFFGPTQERQVGPRGRGPVTILRADDCDGCKRPRLCQRRCLRELDPESVTKAATRMLAASSKLNIATGRDKA